jgi:hypothetical protein
METQNTSTTTQPDQNRLLFETEAPSAAPNTMPPALKPQIEIPPPPASSPTSVTSLPREHLLEQVFQSMCNVHHRRWERELLFGATDDELGRCFGNCHCFGDELNLAFQTAADPALTITYRIFDVPVTTATFAEVAQYVRRAVQIPEKKSDAECAVLLEAQLETIRVERRQQMKSYIRSLIGEKYPRTTRKRKSPSTPEPPSLTNEIADLLFAPDCMSEASDKRLLVRLTSLIHRKANQEILKAADNAVRIINNAKSDWRCYTSYWIDDNSFTSAYKPGKEHVT